LIPADVALRTLREWTGNNGGGRGRETEASLKRSCAKERDGLGVDG